MTTNDFDPEITNANIDSPKYYVDNNGALKFISPYIASSNFDGSIPMVESTITASSVMPGMMLEVYPGEYFPVMSTSYDDTDLEDTPGSNITIGYLNDSNELDSIVYDLLDTISIRYEDWNNKSLGESGWTITQGGNAIFSNVGVRGEIEATTLDVGGVDGITYDGNTVTIGASVVINAPVNVGASGNFIVSGSAAQDIISNNTTITGGNISTGTIKSQGYSGPGTASAFSASGMLINLDDGSIAAPNFKIDKDGNAHFKGQVESASGNIAGFILSASQISIAGFTMSTASGISLGPSSQFKVDLNGNLVATSASISGDITATSGKFTGSVGIIGDGSLYAGTSPTTGQRVVVSSSGLFGFDGGNINIFSIPITGSPTISGFTLVDTGITGSGQMANMIFGTRGASAYNITVRGDKTGGQAAAIYTVLNGAATTNSSGNGFYIDDLGRMRLAGSNGSMIFDGNNLSVTGYINATSGSFAGALSAATGTFAGNLSAAGGTFAGTLSANSITSGTLDASVITVTNLNADNITSGTITGRTIRSSSGITSSTGNGVYLDSSGNVRFATSNGTVFQFDSTGLGFNANTLKIASQSNGGVLYGSINFYTNSGVSIGSISSAASNKTWSGLGDGITLGTGSDYIFLPSSTNATRSQFLGSAFEFRNTNGYKIMSIAGGGGGFKIFDGSSSQNEVASISLTGVFTGDGSGLTNVGGGTSIPSGTITMYGGTSAPSGWLLCNGQAVSRSTYSSLFSIIGTSFGTGNGSTTFNVPDFIAGGPGGTSAFPRGGNTPGNTGGVATHTLTIEQIPQHTHNVGTLTISGTSGGSGTLSHSGTIDSKGAHTHTVSGQVGSGGGHSHTYTAPNAAVQRGSTTGSINYVPNSTAGTATSNEPSHQHGAGTLAADSAGSHQHTVTVNDHASHTHGAGSLVLSGATGNITDRGATDSINNQPPYIVVNFIIKT